MEKQQDKFKAETTWFHVFVSMIENGDVSKLGAYAFAVYIVIKSYVNWRNGKAFPSLDTIVEKTGISKAQVKRSLNVLVKHQYVDLTKSGRKNVYTLREKITLKDPEGAAVAMASWDYIPASVDIARTELKRFLLTGKHDGSVIYIESLKLNLQVNNGDYNFNNQGPMDPTVQASLERFKAAHDKAQKSRITPK